MSILSVNSSRNKMPGRLRIILEFAAGFVVILLLVTAIAGVVVVKFHGEELEAYFMDELNETLDTNVDVEDISVKVFHAFPNTSIVLENITVWSSHHFNRRAFEGSSADTLATAERISVSFNLLGMIRKRFNIRGIEIRKGSLHLLTDRTGEVNYRMFTRSSAKKGGIGSINFSQVNIHEFRIRLENQAKQLSATGTLENLELNGRFSKRNTQIRTTLRGRLEELSNKGILYGSDNRIGIRLNMDVQDSLFTVKAGQLQIDRITADVDGRFLVRKGRGMELELIAAARNMEIHEVLDLIPGEISEPMTQVRGSGHLQVYTRISGMVSSTRTPRIEADFQAANANLYWDRVPFSLKNLNLTGSYSNGGKFSPATTTLKIESISTNVGKDHVSGSASVKNFLDPDFQFVLKGEVHPSQWLEWYPSIPLDRISGTLFSDLAVTGNYVRSNPKGSRFRALDISGGVSLDDIFLRITPGGIPFESLAGSVSIDNDFWEPSFNGNFGSSDFNVSGTGLNLIGFMLGQGQPLIASVEFRSDFLDLQEVLDELPVKSDGNRSAIQFPDLLDLRLEFAIADFSKDQLSAKNVRGVAFYDAPVFFVDSLTMQAMEGTLMGSFGMTQDTKQNIYATVDASLMNLDISQLFRAFNNFGQQQLTSEHLRGTISGKSGFAATFDPSFRIRSGSILSENDLTIRDGELNEFTPLLALSNFIDVEELQSVRFETLQNNIVVKESQVIIPAMDIHSSALDLSASGIHNFDNTYDYRLTLKLSDLLYRKARSKTDSEFNVAEDASDQRTLFLKVSDTGSGSNVEIDREQTAKKVREDLREEKRELKQILNEELGLFRKSPDTLPAPSKETEDKEFLRFDFTEDSTAGEPREGGFWKSRRDRRNTTKQDTGKNKPAEKFVIDE